MATPKNLELASVSLTTYHFGLVGRWVDSALHHLSDARRKSLEGYDHQARAVGELDALVHLAVLGRDLIEPPVIRELYCHRSLRS